MTNNETIVYQPPLTVFRECTEMAIEYAFASLPFTFNRFKKDIIERFIFIYKGKLNEYLMQSFLEANNIGYTTNGCDTEYWKHDKKDIIIEGTIFDFKMLDIFHPGLVLTSAHYTALPSAIPDNLNSSQWNKRTNTIFTFMKCENLKNFYLSPKQAQFLDKRCKEYKNYDSTFEPEPIKAVFNKFKSLKRKDEPSLFTHPSEKNIPPLIICSYATDEHWHLFETKDPQELSIKWPIGSYKTVFTMKQRNKVAITEKLPSVYSRFSQLHNNLNFAMLYNDYISIHK